MCACLFCLINVMVPVHVFFCSFLYYFCLFFLLLLLLLLLLHLFLFSSCSFSMPDFLPFYPPEKALYPSSGFSSLCAVASPWSNPSASLRLLRDPESLCESAHQRFVAWTSGGDLWEKAGSNPSLKKTWLDLVVSK